MKNPEQPLTLIRILSDGQFHSGEQLGALLKMSRAGINKHMQTLREWGVDFYSVQGKGYALSAPLQLLQEAHLRNAVPEGQLFVLPVVDSTNQYLLNRIGSLASGDVCVAEFQQSGRGRRGRQWVSPFGSNLYLSMYWRLEQGPAAATGLSLVVGIVIAEVLRELGAEGVKVKWPNDLYLNDCKLAGVLIEMTGNSGDCAQLVIGAGINLAMENTQSTGIDQQWINLQDAGIVIDRNELAIKLITVLRVTLTQFETEGLTPFLPRWKALDNFMDKPVCLLIGERRVLGVSRGIDAQGALLLEQAGKINAFVGGEISLRAGW